MKILHYIQHDEDCIFVKVKRIINLKTLIMKKMLKFSLVIATVLTAMNVSALGNDFSLDVKKGQGKTVTFALNEINKVELSIYDLDNKLIHSENVNANGNIKRTYDLNALPEGTYFLVAESDTKIAKYEISVVGQTAVLASNAVSEVYKPMFLNKDGLVSLSIFNAHKSPVSIKIYNAADELVYTSPLLVEQNIEKVFEIKNLPFENHTFAMSYDDKVFVKMVAAK